MRRPILLLALLFLTACTREEPASPVPTTPTEGDAEPQTKPGTLRVEGTDEPITLRRVDEGAVPFTTFIPEGDFGVESGRAREGTFARFTAQFGGVLNPDAYVHFVFPDAPLDSVRAALFGTGGRFEREGWQEEIGPSPCLWAHEGFVYRAPGSDATGIVCLGEHAGDAFYLLTHHPAEYGDGFGPRLNVLLDEFRWRDTQQPLRGE